MWQDELGECERICISDHTYFSQKKKMNIISGNDINLIFLIAHL